MCGFERPSAGPSRGPVVVTFGVPTFDSPYLEQAIRSALSQSLSDVEVIVSDDGGRTESAALVKHIGDTRVRYIRTDGVPGVPANWNRCLRLARGKYFVLLPDDDVVAPEFAAQMVAALESRPDAGFAQCGLLAVDERLRVLHDRLVAPPADFMSGCEALAWQFQTLKCNPVAVMFRRDVLNQFGGWQEHFWDDWSVILRIAFRRGFVFVRQPLASNRTHIKNLSKTLAHEGRDEILDLINQHAAVFGDALPVTPELLALRARWNRDLSHRSMIKAIKSILLGRPRSAVFHYRRAHDLYPLAGFHPGFIVVAFQTQLRALSARRSASEL